MNEQMYLVRLYLFLLKGGYLYDSEGGCKGFTQFSLYNVAK